MAKLRLFAAIEVADVIKKKLKECQERLKEVGGDVGWMNVENIHITLKFLGYLEEEHLTQAKDIINQSIQGIKPFSLQFKGIGGFPRFQRPRVIFIAAEDKMGYLSTMNSRLEEGFQALGVEKEDRAYEPHLTLGRVKSPHNIEKLVRFMEKYKGETFGEQLVSRVLLMQSQLTPEGPIYTKLEEFPLMP
ncbi:MAG TPA: RNA 2',3'-cyclic phosphodiesterase [Candidatus Hypogeohydataceae bacterium YC41]